MSSPQPVGSFPEAVYCPRYDTSTRAHENRPVASLTSQIAGLSPEMLLCYMQSQLQGLDDQIGSFLSEMQHRRGRLAELGAQVQTLRQLRDLREEHPEAFVERSGGLVPDGVELGNGDRIPELGNRTVEQILDDCPDVEVAGRLAKGLGTAEIDSMIDDLNDKISGVNDQSEYDAMQVSSLMSKRSQLVQMTSNMMRELNESAMSIVKNI